MSNKYNFFVECGVDLVKIRKIMKGIGKITTKRKLWDPVYVEEFDCVCGLTIHILKTDMELYAVKKMWLSAKSDLHYAYESINTEKNFDGRRHFFNIEPDPEQTGDIYRCVGG